MPQYITHPFLMGAKAGEDMLSRAMDQESRAQAMAYQQQAAETANRNRAYQDILLAREYMGMGLNPKTGQYDPFINLKSKTFGADIVKNLYESYLREGNVMPGKPNVAPTQIVPGGQARILPFAMLPDVPPAYTSKVLAEPMYTGSTLPSIQAGTYFQPNQQKTRD